MAAWKGDVKRHIDTVHEDVRYSCDQCDYKATDKSSLKTHLDSVHGDVRRTVVISVISRHVRYSCDFRIKLLNYCIVYMGGCIYYEVAFLSGRSTKSRILVRSMLNCGLKSVWSRLRMVGLTPIPPIVFS